MKKWIACCFIMLTLAACSAQGSSEQVNATQDADAPIFSVEVTGTIETTLASPDDMSRFWSDDYDTSSPMTTLWIGDGENYSLNIIFFGQDVPESGTYTITDYPYDSDGRGTVYADFTGLTDFDASDTASGTITLERSDQTYSGTFSYQVEGTHAGESVTVTGTFSNFEL